MKVFANKDWIPVYTGMTIKSNGWLPSFPRKRESRRRTCGNMEVHNNKMTLDSCLHRNGNKWFKTKNNKGFTLIEIIILIVMAGILLPAIIVPFVSGVKGSQKPEMVSTAMYLGHQKMEELMKFDYGKAPELNPSTYTLPAPPISNYTWQWVISYVDNNFAASGSDVGYKMIQVTVTDPQGDAYNVYSVVTDFP